MSFTAIRENKILAKISECTLKNTIEFKSYVSFLLNSTYMSSSWGSQVKNFFTFLN